MAAAQAPTSAVAAAIPLLSALVVGACFGLVSALVGEAVQRVFYAHADTHFDPPAAAIVVATLLVSVLATVGVFPQSVWIPALS
jgi:ABC-type dipeptide/oligopeptide/nickel transport system permease subunit